MLFHLFSVVKVLYILISGRYEKQNVKTGQIQKRGKVASSSEITFSPGLI